MRSREGEYVVLTKEEIAAAAGGRSKIIDVEEFVAAGEIDPVVYDRTYYLGARKEGADAYRLLDDALAKSERVAIGRWVFHDREYLVAVRSLDGVLALHTMRFADELVAPGDLDLPKPSRKPSRQEVKMAATLVDSLTRASVPPPSRTPIARRCSRSSAARPRARRSRCRPRRSPTRSPTSRPPWRRA